MINQVKRLRLCVSDNENMRAAFSLLRVMVANEEELVRVTTSIMILLFIKKRSFHKVEFMQVAGSNVALPALGSASQLPATPPENLYPF